MYGNLNGSAHPRAAAEIAVIAEPEDERVWVPQAEGVWFRPLMLNTRQGQWCNLLRVRRSGVLSRHLHPEPGARLRHPRALALPRARLDRRDRLLRLRAARARSTPCWCPRTARRW